MIVMQGTSPWNLGTTFSLEASHSLSALREVSNRGNDSKRVSGDSIPRSEEGVPVIPAHMKLIVNMWHKIQHGDIKRFFFLFPCFSCKRHSWRCNSDLDTTWPCWLLAGFYCCTDGPAAGIPGNVSDPVAVCQHRASESLSHNYLAMQHIIQSSSIQTSAQSSHPSECFLPSQQILVVVDRQGKGLSGPVSTLGECVCVCV